MAKAENEYPPILIFDKERRLPPWMQHNGFLLH